MQPLPMHQFSEGKTDVVPKHLERASQIRPAKQQGTPASADEQPRNVHHAVQHEEVSTKPMKAKSHRQYAWPQTDVVVNPVRWTDVIAFTGCFPQYPPGSNSRDISIAININRKCTRCLWQARHKHHVA